MRALLDTQVFILLGQQGLEKFSSRARKLLEDEDNDLILSAVSIAEIAVKANIGKLPVTATDTSKLIADLRLTLLPFEPRHALRLFDLPLHHRDPFDRMLIATALAEGIPILTRDSEFGAYRGLKLIS